MKIGIMELVLLFIVALLVLGPDKLPEYARKLGEALRQLKKFSNEATKELRKEILEPLGEAQKPLQETLHSVANLEEDIHKDMEDLEKSIKNVGNTAPQQDFAKSSPVPSDTAAHPKEMAQINTAD